MNRISTRNGQGPGWVCGVLLGIVSLLGVSSGMAQEPAATEDTAAAPIAQPLAEIGPDTGTNETEETGLIIRTYGRDAHTASFFVIDDFEGSEVENRLNGRANIYVQFPSRVMISRTTTTRPAETNAYSTPNFMAVTDAGETQTDETEDPSLAKYRFGLRDVKESGSEGPSAVLILKYEKANEGGPFGEGGWCGFYTLLKQMRHGEEDIYFDAEPFTSITFWVRGETGQESFMVGLSDRHWDKVGDSLKSEKIENYLPSNLMSTNWQKATIPLDTYFLDRSKLGAITFSFESACYPDGSGTGTVLIDNIALEK